MPNKATVILLLAVLVSVGGPARAQQPQEGTVSLLVEFNSIHIGQHDDLAKLWPYLDQGTLQGPGANLLKLNGLQMGKLENRFRKDWEQAYKKVALFQHMPQTVYVAASRPQLFDLGAELTNWTLFLWDRPDSFTGRRYDRLRFAMELSAAPLSQDRVEMAITPILRHGPALREEVRLQELSVRTTMVPEETLILMPADTRNLGVGAALLGRRPNERRSEGFILITVKGLRMPAAAH